MFQYIVKRLLLMLVTLFGITVISFTITRLAPGDPAAMKVQGALGGIAGRGQQLSEAIIEDNRRILGLDKPILFNLRPKGRSANVQRLIADLGAPEEYLQERGRKQLAALKTVALPDAVAALAAETTPPVQRRLLDLMPVLSGQKPPRDYTSFTQTAQAGWWRNWWEGVRTSYTLENGRRAVEQYFADHAQASSAPILGLGGWAVPALIAKTRSRDSRVSDLATALLTQITGRPWNNLSAEKPEVRRDNLYRWRNWWRYWESHYVEFTGWRRLVRMVTDTQYGVWFGKVLRFDFDESYTHKRPVLTVVLERIPVSLQLSLIAIFLAYAISIPLGVFSATHQFKLSDKIVTTVLFLLYSLPTFWAADMLILFTTGGNFWKIFPTQGLHSPEVAGLPFWSWTYIKDWLWHLVLPITCLTYYEFAFLSRQSRVAMLETIRQDFIRTAQAKGLSQRAVIFKHALRNSMIPILTLMASLLPELLGGSIIIETIFGIQGMGKLTIDSILTRDYAVINAVAFFSAFLTLLGILLSDLSYALVDPRIRYE
ncbi:MAG: ABC transporter permease subunit [Candidatus Sumerlaeia bacterium]|nr:ABC transporter permease subunit [Candidatus Sumerlaeia bacterium]